MPRSTRTQSAPDPAVNTADQDIDPAISPAPSPLPKSTSASVKRRLIDKSLNKGVVVTILREQSVNGRTHTGTLSEVEAASGEGEEATEALYAVRTGQPGRPVKVTASDIRTIVETQTPVTVEDDDNN